MKKSLLVFCVLGMLILGCEPSDDRPVVTEGMELKMDKQAVCLDDITTLTLTLGDSVVSPSRIKYEINPPVGSVNEEGQYIAPDHIHSSTEVTITARPDFVIGSTSQTILVENADLSDYIKTIEPWNDVSNMSYLILKTRLEDGFALIKEQDRYLQVVKINDSGDVDWVSNFGEGSPWAISSRNNSIYLAGRVTGTSKIIKMDLNGNLLWEKELPSMIIQSIAVNDQDEVFAFFRDQPNQINHFYKIDAQGNELEHSVQEKFVRHARFNNENKLIIAYFTDQYFVSEVDSDGNPVWKSAFATSSNGSIMDINSNNQIVIGNNEAGFFNLKKFSAEGNLIYEGIFDTDEEGDPIHNKRISIQDVTALDNGGVVLMGNSSKLKAMLIDNTGHLKWSWENESEDNMRHPLGWAAFPIDTGYLLMAEYRNEIKSILMNADGTLNPCAQANS